MTPKNLLTYLLFLAFCLSAFLYSSGEARERFGQQQGNSFSKITVIDRDEMDVNTIRAWLRNDGEYFYDHAASGPGLEWPKGGGIYSVFSSSMWIGARVDGQTRVATIGHGGSEMRPGTIVDDSTWTNPGLGDDKYRYYKVRPNVDNMLDADFAQWPADLGAPFYDADGDGNYEPDNGDYPALVWGGEAQDVDMLMYAVYHDANPSWHNQIWGGSRPLKAEIHQTTWAYNRSGPFGQMLFMKFDIYNRGSDMWEDTYLSVWSDPDIGDSFDDYVAVDTTLRLAITYNGEPADAEYGSTPPAVGYVYFQGPRIFTGNPQDSAKWNGVSDPGFAQLGITGFNMYCNPGTGGCTNPDYYDPDGYTQSYNVMRGLTPTGLPWIDPDTGEETQFVFTGDPVTQTGWLQNSVTAPTDVRFTMSAGPFTMEPGDSQQVVIGVVLARGSNNLNSVTVLRENTRLAQALFDNNFKLPSPPPTPEITSTWEQDKLILKWDDAAESYELEDTTFHAFWKMHGYDVYQVEDPLLRPSSEQIRIASFYKEGGPAELYDSVQVGPVTLWDVIWEGETEGLLNFLVLDRDRLRDGRFVPGRPYYFYIQAHAYSDLPETPQGLRLNSSPVSVIEVVPRNPFPGLVYPHGGLGSLIPHSRWALDGDYMDDAVILEVLDPPRLEQGTYQITFDTLTSALDVTSWNLEMISPEQRLIVENNTNFTGDDAVPIVAGGVLPRVVDQPLGVRRDDQEPKGWKYLNATGQEIEEDLWWSGQTNPGTFPMDAADAFVYPRSNFFVKRGNGLSPDRLRRVEIRFSDTNTQYAYRWIFRNPINAPLRNPDLFQPYAINYPAVSPGRNYLYQDFEKNPLGDPDNGVTVPFTVWEVDPLYGTERQLTVGITERNDYLYEVVNGDTIFRGLGNIDGKWDPLHTVRDTAGSILNQSEEGDEMILIFDYDYHQSPDSLFAQDLTNSVFSQLPIMYGVWLKRVTQESRWSEGDVLVVRPNYPLSGHTVFEFEVEEATFDRDLAREQLKRIKVVPNPFYASHELQQHSLNPFVTFTNLPTKCTIRIFNLAGEMVRVIEHDNQGQFDNTSTTWDLKNHRDIPVASGMYIAHISAPNVGEHILKFAIFIQQERLERF